MDNYDVRLITDPTHSNNNYRKKKRKFLRISSCATYSYRHPLRPYIYGVFSSTLKQRQSMTIMGGEGHLSWWDEDLKLKGDVSHLLASVKRCDSIYMYISLCPLNMIHPFDEEKFFDFTVVLSFYTDHLFKISFSKFVFFWSWLRCQCHALICPLSTPRKNSLRIIGLGSRLAISLSLNSNAFTRTFYPLP